MGLRADEAKNNNGVFLGAWRANTISREIEYSIGVIIIMLIKVTLSYLSV